MKNTRITNIVSLHPVSDTLKIEHNMDKCLTYFGYEICLAWPRQRNLTKDHFVWISGVLFSTDEIYTGDHPCQYIVHSNFGLCEEKICTCVEFPGIKKILPFEKGWNMILCNFSSDLHSVCIFVTRMAIQR